MQDRPDKPEGHDDIEASKAPLMDHLIELRQRLIYALMGIGVGFVVCFAFATQIYNLLVWPYLLFITGAMVVYFIVMPLAMIFFLSMEQTGGQVEIHLQARVSEYLSLIMTLILGFGIMFQLPVVLSLLAQAGIITSQGLRG